MIEANELEKCSQVSDWNQRVAAQLSHLEALTKTLRENLEGILRNDLPSHQAAKGLEERVEEELVPLANTLRDHHRDVDRIAVIVEDILGRLEL